MTPAEARRSGAGPELSYRALLRTPPFARLAASVLLARTALQMQQVVLVLLALQRYGSPVLAGLVVLAGTLPGLLCSPLAGALLDRRGRMRLIVLDYAVGAASLVLIGVLARAGALPAAALLLIAAVASLTGPLSNVGTRSLFPLVIPRQLWDRANAVDSGAFIVAVIVGPALGGVLVAAAGAETAVLASALIYAAAAAVVLRVPEPQAVGGDGRLLADAALGLVYVLRNPSLRGLALTVSVYNLGYGVVIVALPVLVLDRLHGTSASVGAMWALLGAGGLVSGLLVGRFDSDGRERRLLAGGALGSVAALALLAAAQDLAVVALGMVLMGLGNGPLDIGLFSLRQRRTDPAMLGRAFAVSMSLNFLGVPVGSALAGPVIGRSLTAALVAGAALTALSGLIPLLVIPPGPRRAAAVRRDASAGQAGEP